MLEKNKFIVDAVIPWVDGSDLNWQNRFNKYSQKKINFDNKKDTVRYNSIGEINIAIKSIIKFAPYIRKIFLVTDNQKPKSFEQLKDLALKKNIDLLLVDHKVIFKGYEDCLPVFNASSIESMVFRIPELAEHFVYFNDDTFLMRKTSIEDFFIQGKPIIRGKWQSFYEDQFFRKNYYLLVGDKNKKESFNKVSINQMQQNSAKIAGLSNYVKKHHVPAAIRKSTLEKFFKNNDILRDNVKYRFRDQSQFVLASMSNHLEIKNNTYIYEKESKLTYIDFGSYKFFLMLKLKLYWHKVSKRKLFMCCQSLELADQDKLDYILNWIDNRLEI